MKINVVLICYNHEKYIQQAIESIFMQRFEGDIEIIVADDCSSDNTLSIIESNKGKSKNKITILKNKNNLGISKNYQRAFEICDGDYIAILEGDDYWTNPNRLQKHISFLDSHRECALSMNCVIQYDQVNGRFNNLSDISSELNYFTSAHMMYHNYLGNLSACVVRTNVIKQFDPRIYNMRFDDWLLGLSVCQFGIIVRFQETMSVYRVHKMGLWSMLDEKEQMEDVLLRAKQYNEFYDNKFSHEYQLLKMKIKKENDRNYYKSLFPSFLYRLILKIWTLIKKFKI